MHAPHDRPNPQTIPLPAAPQPAAPVQTAQEAPFSEAPPEDRRGRLVRRFVYPLLALAAAGLITLLNGCEKGDPVAPPLAERLKNETVVAPVVTPAVGQSAGAAPIDAAALTPLPAPLDGFALFPTDGGIDFLPTADGVRLNGRGYFASTADYGPDFTVAYEYRFPNADEMPEADRPTCNTGCLLFIDKTDKVWPRCLEVQGRWDETAQIKSNARDVTVESTTDEPARDAARKPPGEWNRVEIVSAGGALTASLNGVEVSTSQATDLTRGRIGFQAEGFPVEFRGVTIEAR